jgi:hypothetical protein
MGRKRENFMRLAVLAAVLLSTTPALAIDAIAYKGTLGGHDIIVEFTDPDIGMMQGRYSYMAVGGDIPLHNLDGIDSFEFAEEAPCTEATCVPNDEGMITEPPIGGHWTLNFSDDGKALSGTWAPAGKPGKTLDVNLVEIGRRTLPEGTENTPMGLADSVFLQIYANDTEFSAATAPYDFAKMDVALTEGETQELDGSTFRFVTDPRTEFAFPRIVGLADGSSPDAANRALAERHGIINVAALSCLDKAYAGLSYSGYDVSMEGGSLGDYDGENIAVGYLSPTVMGWTEGGSTWCGGAHPNNHFDSYIIDVKAGRDLPLVRVFKDWTAVAKIDDYGATVDREAALAAPEEYYWSPGQALIDYVLANYQPQDPDYSADCGVEELITTNLGVRFGPGDTAIFSLVSLPHAIFACTDDLVTVPLADIPELLAPTASDYFPRLAR